MIESSLLMIQSPTLLCTRSGAAAADGPDTMEEEDTGASTAVVLHEDKKYYPDADEIYPDAETMVQVRNHPSHGLRWVSHRNGTDAT